MKNTFEKKCTYCNVPFTTQNFRKLYCSKTCRTYACNERKGNLNSIQKAIRAGEIKLSGDAKVYQPIDLVHDHLESLFLVEFKVHLHEKGLNYYYEGYICEGVDIELQLDRVVRLNDEEYLIQTSDEQFLNEIKDKYEGSAIFKGISMPLDFDENGEYESYRIHKMILSKAKIIEIDKLPLSIV